MHFERYLSGRNRVYAQVDLEHGGGGGGGLGRAAPWKPGDDLVLELPKNVAEVRVASTKHTAFEDIGLADDFTFSLWCLFVPKPLANPAGPTLDASRFLAENRQAFGDMLPKHVLLVTRTTSTGVDTAFAGSVAQALGYHDLAFPLLMFFRDNVVRIRPTYENHQTISLKDQPLNGIVVSLGGADAQAAYDLISDLPALLTAPTVPVAKLEQLVDKVTTSARNRGVLKKLGNAAVPTVKVLSAGARALVTGGA